MGVCMGGRRRIFTPFGLSLALLWVALVVWVMIPISGIGTERSEQLQHIYTEFSLTLLSMR
jgi:hypothetical protein